MTDIDDFFTDTPVKAENQTPRLGGKREGAGRKKDVDRAVADKKTGETHFQKYDAARARHESAKADMAEIEALKLAGTVVDREAVREAQAKAYALISQSLDSIPDSLEQELGVDPEVADKVRERIDLAKAALAADLKKIVDEEGEE